MATAQRNFFSLSFGILNIHVYLKNQDQICTISSENKPFCAQCILEKLFKNNRSISAWIVAAVLSGTVSSRVIVSASCTHMEVYLTCALYLLYSQILHS